MPKISGIKEPQSKREFIDRLLSFDFNGDIRSLFDWKVVMNRAGAAGIELTSLETGKRFLLRVSLPRTEAQRLSSSAKRKETMATHIPQATQLAHPTVQSGTNAPQGSLQNKKKKAT